LLSADTVLYGDGGGQAPAVRKPLHGQDRVARTLIGLLGKAAEIGARHEPIVVNGQPGARYLDADGGLINVVALDIADGQIQGCDRSSTRTSCATSARPRGLPARP